jgi:hypothetical protein
MGGPGEERTVSGADLAVAAVSASFEGRQVKY